MASNPRIDELRRRLDKEPRLFAQLAEELRKEGELAEAVRVCREGLSRNPNYPSARITLGRALLDSGNAKAAQAELETALKGAPDNILAGRLLAECLEDLGDLSGALTRYRATLVFTPGDRSLQARIGDLEKRVAAPARPAEGRSLPASAPIPLAQVDGPMEIERRGGETEVAPVETLLEAEEEEASEASPSGLVDSPEPDDEPSPVPLVPMDEDVFELEGAYETPSVQWTASAAPPAVSADDAAAEAPLWAEAPSDPATIPPGSRTAAPDTAFEPYPPEPALHIPAAAQHIPAAAQHIPAAAQPPASELSTATMAEIYLSQGLLDKAVAVYQQVLDRDPTDERTRVRLTELQRAGSDRAPNGGPQWRGPSPERRAAITRTIGRMESWLAALRRATP